MSFAELAIIVLTYNQERLTLRCLESLRPVLEAGARCILIDNASVDGTLDSVRKLALPGLNIISLDENYGVAPARNIGLKTLPDDAKYVMILDNDTIVDVTSLKVMLLYMEADERVGLLGPCLVSPEGAVQRSFQRFPGIGEKIRNFFTDKSTIDTIPHEMEPFYVIGACQLIRRSVIEQIGLLDERIFFGPEDADYCIRVRKAGFHVVYNPSAVIIHDWQRNSRKNPFSRLARKHIIGLLHFYVKYKRFW